jgi:alkanesulfonate monooxygenase SsuD/methylene tetrahydromethanopterin reductase-like flavin-dependent oxidoreductase (luciferase family)
VLPTFPQSDAAPLGASQLSELCTQAEATGATSLWSCDHLFWHGPSMEAFMALAVAATATRGATFGSCVLQLPIRHLPSVAKQAASLSQLSGGRFVLGVGVGAHAGEYAAAGACFAGRGRALDLGIDALRSAWIPSSERYALLPNPPRIPIWIGGASEAALRRAAARGDGWIPLFVTPEEYAAAHARLDKEAERSGRDPADVTRAVVVFVSLGGDDALDRGLSWMSSLYGLPERSFARHLIAGDARACARALARFADAGVEHVAVFVASDAPLVQFADLAGEYASLRALSRVDVPGREGQPSVRERPNGHSAPAPLPRPSLTAGPNRVRK